MLVRLMDTKYNQFNLIASNIFKQRHNMPRRHLFSSLNNFKNETQSDVHTRILKTIFREWVSN